MIDAMKRIRWQLLIIFLTGLVVGFLLLIEQPEPITMQPEAIQGGTYIEALIGQPQRFNPVLDYYNDVDRAVDRLIYSGLLKYDDRGLPLPDLAEAWGVSADGRTYNVQLRESIKFHDGEILTAEDVVFTIELMREGGDVVPQDIQNFWSEIEVVQLADTMLQFRLPEPFSPFTDYLSFGVLPKHLLGHLTFEQIKNDPFNLSPVGSGLYKFDNLIVEDGKIAGVALSINQAFYTSPAYIEQFIFRYYPDSASAFAAYQQDVVQGISVISDDILSDVLKTPDLNLYTSRTPQFSLVFLNLANVKLEFFQDETIRKALLLGINRQKIINQILAGQAIVANSPILPGSWAYIDSLKAYEYDPDQAAQMLKDAGYVIATEESVVRMKEDIALSFEMIYPNDGKHQAIAEAIQRDWAAIGVQVTITPVDYAIMITERLQSRSYEAALVDLNLSRFPDPDPYPFWDQAQATGGQNYSQWDNRIASEYLEQARTITDIDERSRLYRNFQVIFIEEIPSIPLYFPVYTYAVDQEIKGVTIGPLFDSSDRFLTVTDWYLVSRMQNTTLNATTVSP